MAHERPTALDQPGLIMVEGADDLRVFKTAASALSITNVTIIDMGGATNLRHDLQALTNTPGFSDVERFGVVRDADNDPPAALRSIYLAIDAVGLTKPDGEGVLSEGRPKLAALVLPGGGQPGELEDLCIQSVAGAPEMECVEGFMHCLPSKGVSIRKPSKARAHAFVASQATPYVPLGVAVDKGYFPIEHGAFDGIRQFVALIGSA
jgi:hypothetical protein